MIVHRAFTATAVADFQPMLNNAGPCLVWQTCRRQIFFFDKSFFSSSMPAFSDEVYGGLEAEEFLIEVLCGLRSPLVGETEVFGQFRQWWEGLAQSEFKAKFAGRIQLIYAAVKKIREESLCGLGSQSYGSLLRKKLTEIGHGDSLFTSTAQIDFIGAGQLVKEMIPWIQKKYQYRIWCRNPDKVRPLQLAVAPYSVVDMEQISPLNPVLVVAAPLTHSELNSFLEQRTRSNREISLFDLRHDSASYPNASMFFRHYDLNFFTNSVEERKHGVESHIEKAYRQIQNWKDVESSRIQVRPFGWEDL